MLGDAAHPPGETLAAYDAERRPKTAALVASNRQGGPERVVDFVVRRAPQGFADLARIADPEKLKAIVGGYAQMAGFAAPEPSP